MEKRTLSHIWIEIINELQKSISNKQLVQDFILTSKFSTIIQNKIYITVSSIFAISLFKNDYAMKINEIAKKYLDYAFEFEFITQEQLKLVKIQNQVIYENDLEDHEKIRIKNGLVKELNLENFIVGPHNQDIFNAASQILKNNSFFNPLFIHGKTGLGKTHIMMAIGNQMLLNNPEKEIKYIESDTFLRDVFSAISKGGSYIEDLKDDYCHYDLLLIDDIQYLANKEKTNEIFFYIFNKLVKNKKQIIITSDKHPKSLDGLEERMVSRFDSGLTLEMKKPTFETIKKIILLKLDAEKDNYKFSSDAIDELVKYSKNDLRRLIGTINKVIFYAFQYVKPNEIINLALIHKFMGEPAINKDDKYEINPDIIIATICKWYGIREDLIRGKDRSKNISNVRHICMYIIRKKCNLSHKQIGVLFNNRDHTTVMSAIEKINNKLKHDDNLRNYIEEAIQKF